MLMRSREQVLAELDDLSDQLARLYHQTAEKQNRMERLNAELARIEKEESDREKAKHELAMLLLETISGKERPKP